MQNDWVFHPPQFLGEDKRVFRGSLFLDIGNVFAGISYRRSFDGAQYTDASGKTSQKLQYITPVVGAEYNNFMLAYTYSYQSNSVVFNNGGFHQITLGLNFGCKREKYDCNCPSVN